MSGIGRTNNLKISDFNRVAESSQSINLSQDGTVVAKSSFASKIASFFKPEKARRENQQATATFVASITRTLTQGTQSGIFSKLGALSSEQKEAIVANLLNYRDASGKGILDDQLKGAKPLTGRKVAQVIQLVTKQVASQINDIELGAIKGQIDEQVSAGNDLQPQLDRLRFGKLKPSEDAKTIQESASKLAKDLSVNVSKLKKEVVALTKQFNQENAGPDADALDEKITELKQFIKSGELTIRDIAPQLNDADVDPERTQDTRVLASSIGYLSKKEPLPEGAAVSKSILHREKRIDKGDSRTYFETDKTSKVQYSEHIDIGLVPSGGDEVEHLARESVNKNKAKDRDQIAEIRKDLKEDGSISQAEIDDLLTQAKLNDPGVEDLDPNAKKDKIKQANLDYGIGTKRAE